MSITSLVCPFGRRARGEKWSRRGAGGGRFRGRWVDRGEREAIGAGDADGCQSLSGIRLGLTSSDAGSTGIRMAPDGSPGFTGEVELKQRRSRGAALPVCEARRFRGWRLGPRSGVPRWRLMALRASGRNGIGFAWQGSDSALWPRRRRWGSLVGRGRKKSWSVAGDGCRGRKHDGSRKARPEAAALRFDRRTRERGRPGERTAVRTGEVEWETDDVDRRTALGRRKQGVRSMPEQRDFPLSTVAIA